MGSILMVGTSPDTRGGISSVVRVYRQHGLFQRCGVRYISTHIDGSHARKVWYASTALAQYARAMIMGDHDLVHIHLSSGASFWRKAPFFLLAFLFDVPVVLHLHSGRFDVFFGLGGRLQQSFVRFIFRNSARIIVLSKSWRKWVREVVVMDATYQHVVVIPNPVVMPQETNWEDRTPGTVLVLGRLCVMKGTYDLMDAVKIIAPRHENLRLILAGDGERWYARTYAHDLGIAKMVDTPGWVIGEAKDRLLSTASVFVLPSYSEALPMSLLEAMANGIPVVSTKVGGIPEVLTDGIEGFMVDYGNIQQLADRLDRLLCNERLSKEMGENGRRKIQERFSADVILPKVETLYDDILRRDAITGDARA